MDKFQTLLAFTHVVDAGSFSEAARQLNTSKSAISKHITALETALGTRLLNRTTRRLALTASGEDFYRRSKTILSDLTQAEEVIRDTQSSPIGHLRLTAPLSFGIRHLGDTLTVFSDFHPKISIDLELSDRKVDLIAEKYDLAIRIGKLEDSTYKARQLAPSQKILAASPTYLQQNGTPKHPKDLLNHRCLIYSLATGPMAWRFKRKTISIHGQIRANNGDILCELACADKGIVLLPSFIVSDDVRKGNLISLLEEEVVQDENIYAVYPNAPRAPTPVRLFIDFMAERCSPSPYWDLK